MLQFVRSCSAVTVNAIMKTNIYGYDNNGMNYIYGQSNSRQNYLVYSPRARKVSENSAISNLSTKFTILFVLLIFS
jgi:hypothetical protein